MINAIIVEDELTVAQTNARYLQHFPEILVKHVFMNGVHALEHMRDNNVDLALIDISMPSMNGVDLLRQMRQEHITTDVIVVTASTDVKDLDTMLGLGIIDCLVKPFELDRFKRAIHRFLNKRLWSQVSQLWTKRILIGLWVHPYRIAGSKKGCRQQRWNLSCGM